VLGYFRNSRVVQEYMANGVEQGYMCATLVHVYSSSIEQQGPRRGTRVQV